uniref:basic proline-rich protein-like n=1 Tax=Panthera onca TaxID=9690 RepID=UPI002952E1D1|nr:basic proline-rich protein-like [Panthera onca]
MSRRLAGPRALAGRSVRPRSSSARLRWVGRARRRAVWRALPRRGRPEQILPAPLSERAAPAPAPDSSSAARRWAGGVDPRAPLWGARRGFCSAPQTLEPTPRGQRNLPSPGGPGSRSPRTGLPPGGLPARRPGSPELSGRGWSGSGARGRAGGRPWARGAWLGPPPSVVAGLRALLRSAGPEEVSAPSWLRGGWRPRLGVQRPALGEWIPRAPPPPPRLPRLLPAPRQPRQPLTRSFPPAEPATPLPRAPPRRGDRELRTCLPPHGRTRLAPPPLGRAAPGLDAGVPRGGGPPQRPAARPLPPAQHNRGLLPELDLVLCEDLRDSPCPAAPSGHPTLLAGAAELEALRAGKVPAIAPEFTSATRTRSSSFEYPQRSVISTLQTQVISPLDLGPPPPFSYSTQQKSLGLGNLVEEGVHQVKCFQMGNAFSDGFCDSSGAEIFACLFMRKLRHRTLARPVHNH